jgi:hypothetical protein
MFMEIGRPTSGSGSEAEQLAFLQRLPHLLRGLTWWVSNGPYCTMCASVHSTRISIPSGFDIRTVG